MKASILAASLATIGFAAASPTPTVAERATNAGLPAGCYYSPVAPSTTAYVANMPNDKLNANQINTFFNQFNFGCIGGRNFTAYRLTTSTLTPKPWFGGNVYQPSSPCSIDGFQGNVGSAMQYQNSGGNSQVSCTLYTGTTGNAFQQEAKKYFASVKK